MFLLIALRLNLAFSLLASPFISISLTFNKHVLTGISSILVQIGPNKGTFAQYLTHRSGLGGALLTVTMAMKGFQFFFSNNTSQLLAKCEVFDRA